jgi:hypothetical protein
VPSRPPPQNFAARADAPHRVVGVRDEIGDFVRDHDGPCPAGGTPPRVSGAEKLRVQCAAVQCHPQRQAGAQHPPRKFVDKARCRGKPTRLVDKPSGNGRNRLVARPLRLWQLRFLGQDQIAPFGKRCGLGAACAHFMQIRGGCVIAPNLSTDLQSADMMRRN